MACGAIHNGIAILQAVHFLQVVGNDSMVHVPHIPGNLFGRFVLFFPLTDDMAVGATCAQRTAEAALHNIQEVSGRNASHNLDIFENRFRGLGFLAGNLFFEDGKLVCVELLDFLGGRRLSGLVRFLLLPTGKSNSEQTYC